VAEPLTYRDNFDRHIWESAFTLYVIDIPEWLISNALVLMSAWEENGYQQSNC
jgi:hypothetical protein